VFRSSIKVFIPENNLGKTKLPDERIRSWFVLLANEGSHMWNMIKKLPDLRCFWQKNDRPGIHKGKDTADEYQYIFNVKLKNDAVMFDSELFTTSRKHTLTSIRATLQEQMERFHYAYEEPNTIHQKGKQTITGKIGSSEQDDLMIAVLMGVFWGRVVLKDPRRIE